MARIGLITFSDGRDFVYRDLDPFHVARRGRDRGRARAAGHEVIRAGGAVWTKRGRGREARRVADARPDLGLQHPGVGVPAFHDARRRGRRRAARCCSPTSIRSTPEWSGCSRRPGRWTRSAAATAGCGATSPTPPCWPRRDAIRAGAAVPAWRGSTFGRIGGRPMGMYTAVADTDQWIEQFGVDVEEIDQWEIVRRSLTTSTQSRVTPAREWLERHAAGVHYDGDAAHARAARAPDPLLLRDARADRRVEPRLLRDQGPARADHALRHDGHHRGVPQRPLRLGRAQGHPRVRHRGRHGRRADDADAQAPDRDAGAVRRRAALPRRPRHLGSVQLRPARDLVRRAQRRPGREPAHGAPLPGGVLLPRRRRLGPPPRRAGRRSRSRG